MGKTVQLDMELFVQILHYFCDDWNPDGPPGDLRDEIEARLREKCRKMKAHYDYTARKQAGR